MADEIYIDFPDSAAQIDAPQPTDLLPIYRLVALDGDPAAVSGLASIDLAQIRQMAAIDYSLLTEQVVPGEFWRSADGTKKQVYVRTFVGITSRSVLNAGSMDRKI